MRKTGSVCMGVFSCLAMFVLIMDGETALQGAADGIDLCIKTVIPSLFPFFVLSGLLRNAIAKNKLSILRPVGNACGIPENCLYLLLIGLIGGYPVGAQYIYQAYTDGQISKATAKRMLGFCNNAGPAFIFGMCARLFDSAAAGWALWLIHILSALIAGLLLPRKTSNMSAGCSSLAQMKTGSVFDVSIKSMSYVCGWVVLFRTVIAFLRRWFLWQLPQQLQVLLIGLLELTNGCAELNIIENEFARFLLCVCMLNFGGLCVGMQTLAVSHTLKAGWHFPGKILQAAVGIMLCCLLHLVLQGQWVLLSIGSSLLICMICFGRKKDWLFINA